MRPLIVEALLEGPAEAATEYLREAAKDPDEDGAKTAFVELVGRGHEATVAEALADPHTRHRGLVTALERGGGQSVQLLGVPIRLSETPASVRTHPPERVDHPDDVRRQLGDWVGESWGAHRAWVG